MQAASVAGGRARVRPARRRLPVAAACQPQWPMAARRATVKMLTRIFNYYIIENVASAAENFK